MDYKEIAYSPVTNQIKCLQQILNKSHVLCETFKRLDSMEIPNCYIGGGPIAQTVWNHFHGFNLIHGIKDFDIVYFDSRDISYEAEDIVIKKGERYFTDWPVKVEIRNEARVHLWYGKKNGKDIEPFISVEHAISTFPTTATAVGGRLIGRKWSFFIPRGLTDLFGLTVRANKVHVNRQIYDEKSNRYKSVWPMLTIIPWDYRDYQKIE